jgi:hypothetical protein
MQLSKFGIYVYILNVVDWVRERRLGMRDGRIERTEFIGDLIFISDLPILIWYK